MPIARLIPVTGIGSAQEAEQRATSAFLAVLTIVRDLSIDLLSPLGASRAQKAEVVAHTEVPYKLNGRSVRPDGLVTVTYGRHSWSALVEVKTGNNTLDADQINSYWDIARENNLDHVITISNEIAPIEGTHPTAGLRVRSNSKVQVTHYSWTAILTSAIRIKQHAGVDDPEQAWLLGELIRYLQHPASGALAFDDMGQNWVSIRDAAREASLSKRSGGIEDVCTRWDQLLRFAALKLGSDIGEDVTHVLSKAHRDQRQRLAYVVEHLCADGVLDGEIRIPNTAGDLEVTADVRAQRISAAIMVGAPQDKGARGRISWLVNQIKTAPSHVVVESWPKNARTPVAARLDEVLEDRSVLIGDDKKEAHRFRVAMSKEMGRGRRTGTKNPGFITSVLNLIDSFYGEVMQDITPWQPPAPKLVKPTSRTTDPGDKDENDNDPLLEREP